MGLRPGMLLAHYEIIGALGAGGMGEVWRARDTKLKREVALKILPAQFADSPDRLARFEREAVVLASLNHPNIAAIYELGHANDIRFLVLELVEGPTLDERLLVRADSCARGHRHRGANRRSAGGRPRQGHPAPRSQAGQRQADPRRKGQGAGFRPCQGLRRRSLCARWARREPRSTVRTPRLEWSWAPRPT